MQLCRFLVETIDCALQFGEESVGRIWLRQEPIHDLSYFVVRPIAAVLLGHPHVVRHQSRDGAFHRSDFIPELPVTADQVAPTSFDLGRDVRQGRVKRFRKGKVIVFLF